ncbi:flagellar basal body P-ring protein FlgI [Vibrio breoganii]|uniref:flagellar basal body P-ring protein FlgI n=2 Tax=Vibrio TaxID=662 RepID=UPI000C8345A5|nr:flagellar basal body P-ring protein FlgI [Vibrio breoganii]
MRRRKKPGAFTNRLLVLFAVVALFTALTNTANAQSRVGDITSVYGDRDNQLVGYGVVVGLDGTGDKSSPFTQQSVVNMLKNFDVQLGSRANPRLRNVASVMVTANLGAHSVPGQTLDVTVSSVGDARSLQGGTLLITELKGLDGHVYGIAQGNLVVGGYTASGSDGSSITHNIPTVGRVPNGATVERSMPESPNQKTITLSLTRPHYQTSVNIANRINEQFGGEIARAVNKGVVEVDAPLTPNTRVSFLSLINELVVKRGVDGPQVVYNSRTGTVVVGQNVTVSRAAVSQGGLTVTISEDPFVSQPAVLSKGETVTGTISSVSVQEYDSGMMVIPEGASLQDLVDTVNAMGATPAVLVQILQALDRVGALNGELIII